MEFREQGLGNRGWRGKNKESGLATPASLGFLLTSLTLFGAEAFAAESDGRPRITVITNNLAQAPSRTLEEAKVVATRILQMAGVQCVWREPADIEAVPADSRRRNEVRVTLNIISREMSAALARGQLSLGLSILPGKKKRGDIGYVFYHRVEELAQGERVSAGQILGHAMAHEIGHLLLNSSAHSRVGVMQADWRGPQMQSLRDGRLFFSSDQSLRIRAEVRARAEREALRQPQEAPSKGYSEQAELNFR